MFGLRLKLVLGFGGLLALLALLGFQSIYWLNRLGGSIDVILRENYDSVVACEEMKEALERMDSGALFALAGDPAQGQALAAQNEPLFRRALDRELHNITLPGEGPLAYGLRDLFEAYPPALRQVLAPDAGLAARRQAYFNRLLPLFQRIKSAAGQIQQMNQRNMVAANAQARALARRASRRMVLMLALGAGLAIACVVLLSSAVLAPLRRLTQSTREIERGNLDLVVPVPSHDELGQLAAAFNSMAGHLRELRRSNQAQLLRAQQTSQLAIDSLPDAVAVFSPELIVELANRTAVSTLGLRPGEAVPPRHAGWLPELLARTLEAGGLPERGYEGALQIFHEGRERFYLPHAVTILGAGDQLVGITLILSDVTNLRRLDEMKSGLLSTVSHELRTPLTSLQMALHILLEEKLAPLTAEQAELLVAARDDAERLRQILANLLEISRLESGGGQLHFEPVAPRDLIEHAVSGLRSAFADGGIDLAVEVDPAIPQVNVDPSRAGIVLSNLLLNALKHTPAGGSVTVRAAPAQGAVRFSVSDTGRGIPEAYLSRVFDKFFQVPGTEALGGAGLGLAIAKEIVQAHGGRLGAESTASPAAQRATSAKPATFAPGARAETLATAAPAAPGNGATFWFTLPAVAAALPGAPGARGAAQTGDSHPAPAPATSLPARAARQAQAGGAA